MGIDTETKLLPKVAIEFTPGAIGAYTNIYYTNIYDEDGEQFTDVVECVLTIKPDKMIRARCIHADDDPFSDINYVKDYHVIRISVRDS